MQNPFVHLKDYLRYREAVRKADQAHAESGERYYVMPSVDAEGNPKLVIMDRFNFRKLKQKRYISHKATVQDLKRECFYHTPYRDGTDPMDKFAICFKKEMYYSYCIGQRKLMKKKKGGRK